MSIANLLRVRHNLFIGDVAEYDLNTMLILFLSEEKSREWVNDQLVCYGGFVDGIELSVPIRHQNLTKIITCYDEGYNLIVMKCLVDEILEEEKNKKKKPLSFTSLHCKFSWTQVVYFFFSRSTYKFTRQRYILSIESTML